MHKKGWEGAGGPVPPPLLSVIQGKWVLLLVIWGKWVTRLHLTLVIKLHSRKLKNLGPQFQCAIHVTAKCTLDAWGEFAENDWFFPFSFYPRTEPGGFHLAPSSDNHWARLLNSYLCWVTNLVSIWSPCSSPSSSLRVLSAFLIISIWLFLSHNWTIRHWVLVPSKL